MRVQCVHTSANYGRQQHRRVKKTRSNSLPSRSTLTLLCHLPLTGGGPFNVIDQIAVALWLEKETYNSEFWRCAILGHVGEGLLPQLALFTAYEEKCSTRVSR